MGKVDYMFDVPTQINTFGIKAEQGQNPYCGIMSFQHFRDEEL